MIGITLGLLINLDKIVILILIFLYVKSVYVSLCLIFSQYLVGFSIDIMFLLNLFLNSVFYATYKWIFKFITNYL